MNKTSGLRRGFRRGWLAVGLAVVVALAGCSAGGSVDGEGGDELVIGVPYDAGTFDPQIAIAHGDRNFQVNIFEGLVKYENGGTKIAPGLATEWSSNASGTTWNLQLREGVEFQKNYGDFSAEDVLYTFERLADPETASPNAAQVSGIVDIKARGDFEVEFTLDAPDPTFLHKLASWYTGIVSKKAVEEKGAQAFGTDPVGTGPYQFEHWRAGEEVALARFDKYWGAEKPEVDKVVFKSIPDQTTLYNAFDSGDLDLIQVADPDRFQKYSDDESITMSEATSLGTRHLGMHVPDGPFSDVRVRQAVAHAVNRPALIEALYKGVSVPGDQILAPDVEYSKSGLIQYEYDPNRAKDLLAEAGFGDGLSIDFWVPNAGTYPNAATVIQQDLAEVGIKANIKLTEAQAFHEEYVKGKMPLFITNRTQDPVPDRVVQQWFHSEGELNGSQIDDPQIDTWIDEASKSMDEGRRQELIGKVQESVAASFSVYVIDHESSVVAMKEHVGGVIAHPSGLIRLDRVSVD